MECKKAAELIPLFLDNQLEADRIQSVKEHLAICAHCQKEIRLYEKSWELLSDYKAIEPQPDYISRFWTRLSLETSWYEELIQGLKGVLLQRRLVSILTAVSIFIVAGFLSYRNLPIGGPEKELAKMNPDEIELVEHLELAQHFDIIENIDTIEDLDVVENLDSLES